MELSHRCLNLISLPKVTGCDVACIPCGQCSECLKRKGNELAVRLIRECMSKKYAYMLTFTYDNEHLPILKSESNIDFRTGEILSPFSRRFITDSAERKFFFDNCPFTWQFNKKGERVKRYSPLCFESWNGVYTSYYQSLNYDDFKCMLKRVRHKIKTPFKYCSVPEYGGVGYRPHIHFILVGLPLSEVQLFVNAWTFGHVDVREIGSDSLDKTADFGKISAYVSKYASKGKFDCPYIFEGLCLKPRRCSSVSFGFGDEGQKAALQSYLFAFDLYGEYDVTNPPDNISIDILKQRRRYALNGYNYPLPKYFVHHFFYQRYYDKLSQRYFSKATPLQKQIGSSLLADIVRFFERESEKMLIHSQGDCSALIESALSEECSRKIREFDCDTEFRRKILDSIY